MVSDLYARNRNFHGNTRSIVMMFFNDRFLGESREGESEYEGRYGQRFEHFDIPIFNGLTCLQLLS